MLNYNQGQKSMKIQFVIYADPCLNKYKHAIKSQKIHFNKC